MKKRIIAALTALVMVVTMIPANAFAATTPIDEVAANKIQALVEGTDSDDKATGSVTVHYTNEDLKALNDATVAYENLGSKLAKDEFADKYDAENGNWAAKLGKAQELFAEYIIRTQNYKKAADALEKGKLTKAAYDAFDESKGTNNLGDCYAKLGAATEVADGGLTLVADASKLWERTSVDMSLIGSQLKEDLKALESGITFKSEDVDVTNANKVIPGIMSRAGKVDTVFSTALEKVEAIGDTYNIDTVAKTKAGAGFDAITEANKSLTSGATALQYIDYSAKYNNFYRVYTQKLQFDDIENEMVVALNSLRSDGVTAKPGSTENFAKIDYTVATATATRSGMSSADKQATVNAGNYEAAKVAYEAATTVFDKYKDDKYGKIENDVDTTKEKLDVALKAMRSAKKDEAEDYTGTLEQYERAVEAKTIIEKLATKDKFDAADYAEYAKLKGYADQLTYGVSDVKFNEMDIDTFADAKANKTNQAFDRLDNFFTDKDGVAFKHELQAKFVEISAKAALYKSGITVVDLAVEYGKMIHDEIAKLPNYKDATIKDKATIEAIVKIMSDYMDNRAALFGPSPAKVAVTYTKENGLKFASTNITVENASAQYDVLDKNFAKSEFSKLDLQKLAAVAKEVNDFEKADNNYTRAVTALNTYAEEVTVLTEGKYDATKEFTANTYTKLLKVKNDAFDTAFNKLNADEKAALDADQLAIANENKKAMATYEKLIKKETLDKLKEIATLIGENGEGLTTIAEGKTANYDIDDKFFAANKTILDKVDAIFAQDADLEIFFRQVNGTSDGLLAKSSVETALYNARATRLDNVRAEYNAQMIKPEVDPAATNVENLIKAIPELNSNSTYANAKAAVDPWIAADKAYNELTNVQKSLVKNASELPRLKKVIKDTLSATMVAEIAEVLEYKFGDDYSADQKAFVRDAKAVLDKTADNIMDGVYEIVNVNNGGTADTMFPGNGANPFSTVKTKFFNAYTAISNEDIKPVVEEINAVYKTIKDAVDQAANAPKNATEAKKIVDGVEAYNKLSDAAKTLLVDAKLGDYPSAAKDVVAFNKASDIDGKLLKQEKAAKTFLLDYATITPIADQTINDGEYAKPVIEIKDFSGNVIDAKEYSVVYENNDKAGEAKVVVTSTGTKYAGTITATFNVVMAEKPAAAVEPTGLQVIDTDNGILKIGVDKVEGIEGLTYKFFVKKIGVDKWIASKEKTDNFVTFTGLAKNAKYEVKAVTMLNGESSTEARLKGVVYTNRVGDRAATMYKPSIKNVTISNRVAKITVNKVKYNNVKYALGYKKAGAKDFKWFAPNAKTVKTLKNLKKGVKYTFTIRYQYTSEVSGTVVKNNTWAKYVTKVAK